LLPKRALLAITHAFEDESVSRGQRPVLIACFQHDRFYRASEKRWRALTRTADQAVVLAEFARTRRRAGDGPIEVALQPTDPMCREWVLVCDADGFAACVIAWERLERSGGQRWFESIWSVEPPVVRVAARACCELAARESPNGIDELRQRLSGPAPPNTADPRAVIELTNRIVLYATRGEHPAP
jgi:DICT domain-containing protein